MDASSRSVFVPVMLLLLLLLLLGSKGLCDGQASRLLSVLPGFARGESEQQLEALAHGCRPTDPLSSDTPPAAGRYTGS